MVDNSRPFIKCQVWCILL